MAAPRKEDFASEGVKLAAGDQDDEKDWGKVKRAKRERTSEQGDELKFTTLGKKTVTWLEVAVDGVGHKSGGPGYCECHVQRVGKPDSAQSRRFMSDDGPGNWWVLKQAELVGEDGAIVRIRAASINGWGGHGEVDLEYQVKKPGSLVKSAGKN
jgi:hypothetical protein